MFSFRCASILFLSFLFILPASLFAQTNDSLLSQLARKWNNAKEYTLQTAEMMPEEFYDFKPMPEERSFKEQLLHTAQNIQWLSSTYLFAETKQMAKDTAYKTKAEIIKILSDAYDEGMEAHQKIKTSQLDETVSFFAGPMSRRQILLLLHDHQTHHLGQLVVYLRLKGIKPPAYVGW